MRTWVACVLIMLVTGGCDFLAAKYVDASGDAGVRELVSTRRTTTTDLLLLGIDSYPSRRKIAYYVLVPSPGFDGPEVLSRAVLPKGTQIHITGAKRCTNCSPQRVRLRVEADAISKSEDVYIDLGWMGLLE